MSNNAEGTQRPGRRYLVEQALARAKRNAGSWNRPRGDAHEHARRPLPTPDERLPGAAPTEPAHNERTRPPLSIPAEHPTAASPLASTYPDRATPGSDNSPLQASASTWLPRPSEPYEPGNTAALKHGAYSERAIAARAELVHDHLLDLCPYLDAPQYAPSLLRYCQATAREQLAHEALMGGAKLSPRLLEAATAAARLAWQIGDALGLTPAGHAKLKMLAAGGVHAERSLADLMAEGQAAIDAQEAGQ